MPISRYDQWTRWPTAPLNTNHPDLYPLVKTSGWSEHHGACPASRKGKFRHVLDPAANVGSRRCMTCGQTWSVCIA